MLKNKYKFILICSLFSLSCFGATKDYKKKEFVKLELNSFYQYVAVDTDASSSSKKANGSFNYLGVTLDGYKRLAKNYELHIAYLSAYSVSNFTTYDGVEVGIRYNYKGLGIGSVTSTPEVILEILPVTNFWVELNFKSLKFETETIFIRFVGGSLKTGFEHTLIGDYYWGLGLGVDFMRSGTYRSLTAFSGLLSLNKRLPF